MDAVVPADRARTPDPGSWQAPPIRAEALVLTWAVMVFGHAVVAALAVFALAGGASDRSDAAIAAFCAILTLGVAGALVGWHGLAVTLSVRRAEAAGRTPRPRSPTPLVAAGGLALLAGGVAIILVSQWSAAGALPAVGGELAFVPLAVRTQRYLDDARAAALPWR